MESRDQGVEERPHHPDAQLLVPSVRLVVFTAGATADNPKSGLVSPEGAALPSGMRNMRVTAKSSRHQCRPSRWFGSRGSDFGETER